MRPIAGLSLALVAQTACACSCSSPHTPEAGFESASAVFVARAASASASRPIGPGHFLELPGYVFTVEKTWKGTVPASFSIGLPSGCSLWNFDDGERYLVYLPAPASGAAGVPTEIPMCSRSAALQDRQIEARYLDALTAGTDAQAIDADLPRLATEADSPRTRVEALHLIHHAPFWEKDTMLGPVASLTPTWNDRARLALLSATRDGDARVRATSAYVLSNTHRRDPSVQAALLRLLQDDAAEVRAAAAQGLWQTGRGDAETFRHLAAALAAEPGRVRADAAQRDRGLSALIHATALVANDEAQRREAVELLIPALDLLEDPVSAAHAIGELGGLGTAARAAVPTVLSLLRTTDNDYLREHALETLGKIGDHTLADEIAGYVSDEDCRVAGNAMSAMHALDNGGFPDVFRSIALPVLQRRFVECAYPFAKILRGFEGLGHELRPEAEAALRAAHPYSLEKPDLEALLQSWDAAPQDLGLR
jgi:hypothetical protein